MSSSGPGNVVFTFDAPPATDPSEWAGLLGGKGAGLARMCALGLPVPPGFTIPTGVCNRVRAEGWSAELDVAIAGGIDDLERSIGRRLGDAADPLLVSVRSGAPVSMPGMMDTVLNAGMTRDVALTLNGLTGAGRFGWDTYRRFIESYATVVCGADPETLAARFRSASGVEGADQVETSALGSILDGWREALVEAGHVIPAEPRVQVVDAVKAVFASWESERAMVYREAEGIADSLGTAATVQAMVFGNRSDRSGTGVAFTRDPSTGTPGLIGDFLVGAQGEDVVAGTHATQSLAELEQRWPELAEQLQRLGDVLEHDLADLVDIEFTIEEDHLWVLQARVGKRSPRAAVRVAVAMADDESFPLDRRAAVERVAHLLDEPPTEAADDEVDEQVVLVSGIAASPGRAIGSICVDATAAVEAEAAGADVILVRPETSPADIAGMAAALGLVTSRGGLMSHAAVVARSWGVPAVVGAVDVQVEQDQVIIGDRTLPAGTVITVDGDGGRVLLGAHPGRGIVLPEVRTLLGWRDELDATSPDDHGAALAGELSNAACRRALVLKGMATVEGVAAFAEVTVEAAAAAVSRLVDEGHLQAAPGDRFMITPDGNAAAEADYAIEAEAAGPIIEPQLDRFHALNHRFKEVVTSWQMREVDGEQVLNDHLDEAYDAAVLDVLTVEVHDGICAIVAAIAGTLPRLAVYERRLSQAVDDIQAGDTSMVASPLKESYHTVWFELHEELIRLSGRNRADEAAAGRA